MVLILTSYFCHPQVRPGRGVLRQDRDTYQLSQCLQNFKSYTDNPRPNPLERLSLLCHQLLYRIRHRHMGLQG